MGCHFRPPRQFYQPYQKPANRINYIHVESNDAPNIVKQITKTIKKIQLFKLSSNEQIFNESARSYSRMKINNISLATNNN